MGYGIALILSETMHVYFKRMGITGGLLFRGHGHEYAYGH